MSKLITLARPYAKAIFDLAVEQQTIAQWQEMLIFSAEISRNKLITKLISSTVTSEKLAEIFITVCGDKLNTEGQNLIKIMAKNRRLIILPNVLTQFMILCAIKNKTLEVKVISALSLTKEQLIKINTVMKRRLSRNVKLNCKIDKSIVAGVIIHTDDIVIDGSVRGRLERLTDMLMF